MDVLADVLRVSGARGSLGTRTAAGGRWGLWLDDFPGPALHAIANGNAWLAISGRAPTQLRAGDVVLLPPGTRHGLSSAPGVHMGTCDAAAAKVVRDRGDRVVFGTSPPETELITVHYEQDPEVRSPVLEVLGEPVSVSARCNSSLAGVISLLAHELSRPGIGTVAAVNSLTDLLLVQLIRSRLDARSGPHGASWLGATADPVVRDALEAIHAAPEKPWTTTSLAHHIAVSRATLARRFPHALGQPPGEYLAQWRMNLAALRLRDTDEPVEIVAKAVGYSSSHAFSRAFKRLRGSAPGEYRIAARLRCDSSRDGFTGSPFRTL
ncbi:Helix-turn-helix domain-containing protein [Lentzea xinjiangensis]|uniref:Helix-turn-helix domain-containing protein n=1 Tax=Lentzea xinjiangensis TaxID=402600 RepID=A0A1H9JQB9_9PSEU|nr:AraC family transcriptional regulator [Lentzea xinjiangensis]SEQ88765.1 Helix-turn-helix domain-containing protein [Lentzea xinjiangensis]